MAANELPTVFALSTVHPERNLSRILNADIRTGTDIMRKEGADRSRYNSPTTIFRNGVRPPRTMMGRRRRTLKLVSLIRTEDDIHQNHVSY
eukprot:2630044-Pleurochrysis_carterae.AAC.8